MDALTNPSPLSSPLPPLSLAPIATPWTAVAPRRSMRPRSSAASSCPPAAVRRLLRRSPARYAAHSPVSRRWSSRLAPSASGPTSARRRRQGSCSTSRAGRATPCMLLMLPWRAGAFHVRIVGRRKTTQTNSFLLAKTGKHWSDKVGNGDNWTN